MLNKHLRTVTVAEMQGLSVVNEKRLEMITNSGTGFGTALSMDGHLMEHLDLSHHPVTKNKI